MQTKQTAGQLIAQVAAQVTQVVERAAERVKRVRWRDSQVVARAAERVKRVRRRDSLSKGLLPFAIPNSEDLASWGLLQVASLHIQ